MEAQDHPFSDELEAIVGALTALAGRIKRLDKHHEAATAAASNDSGKDYQLAAVPPAGKTAFKKAAVPPAAIKIDMPDVTSYANEPSPPDAASLSMNGFSDLFVPDIAQASLPCSDDDAARAAELSDWDDDAPPARQTTQGTGAGLPSPSMSATSTLVRSSMTFRETTLRPMWTKVPAEGFEFVQEQFTFQVMTGGSYKKRHSIHIQAQVAPRRNFLFMVMSPIGYPRLSWNVLSLGLIVYDLFMIPMQALHVGSESGFIAIEWMATLFWTFDVLLNFRTGHFVGSHLEMRPSQIALKYARTWLGIDLVIVTLEWVSKVADIIGSASLLRSSRVIRTIRFVKLLRLAKMKDLGRLLKEQINSNFVHLIVTITAISCVLIVCIHIISCVWYAIGESSSDGWISHEKYQGRKDSLFWYISSSRWVIAQLNGRTDLDPERNMNERLFACVVGVTLGVLARAALISIITRTMLDLKDLVSEQTRRQRLVFNYLEKFPVPVALTASVKRYLRDYQDADKDQESEIMILSILPKHVRTQLLFEVRSPVMVAHSLFSNLSNQFQWFMRSLCGKVVKLATATTYEVIFDKGDACSRLLFMDKMVATYIDAPCIPDMQPKASWPPSQRNASQPRWHSHQSDESCSHDHDVDPGIRIRAHTWICEPALWCEWLNKGRLVAASHGHMFGVDATDLAYGLQNHPDAFALTVLYARAFVGELRTKPVNSDIIDFIVEFSEVCPIQIQVSVNAAHDLPNVDGMLSGLSDPYCICKVQDDRKARSRTVFTTHTVNDCLDPVWKYTAPISLCGGQSLMFEVWDSEPGPNSDRLLGLASLEPSEFLPQGFEAELELQGGISKKFHKGSLSIKVENVGMAPITGRPAFDSQFNPVIYAT